MSAGPWVCVGSSIPVQTDRGSAEAVEGALPRGALTRGLRKPDCGSAEAAEGALPREPLTPRSGRGDPCIGSLPTDGGPNGVRVFG